MGINRRNNTHIRSALALLIALAGLLPLAACGGAQPDYPAYQQGEEYLRYQEMINARRLPQTPDGRRYTEKNEYIFRQMEQERQAFEAERAYRAQQQQDYALNKYVSSKRVMDEMQARLLEGELASQYAAEQTEANRAQRFRDSNAQFDRYHAHVETLQQKQAADEAERNRNRTAYQKQNHERIQQQIELAKLKMDLPPQPGGAQPASPGAEGTPATTADTTPAATQ